MKSKPKNPSFDSLIETAATLCFLHDLFRYPSQEQWEWLMKQEVQDTLGFLIKRHAPNHPAGQYPYPTNRSEYEEIYLSTFVIGLPHPPCPLIESHWNKKDPIPKILHENMLFYKQFGLMPKENAKESSDHLLFQLEFLSFLIHTAADTLKKDEEEGFHPLMKASLDYCQRHLMSWIPKAQQSLESIDAFPWLEVWFITLHGVLRTLEEQLQSAQNEIMEKE